MVNGAVKIVGGHRDRLAVVYLRQSSMAQVREHTESTMRQYGLVEEAVRLGWAREAGLVERPRAQWPVHQHRRPPTA